MTPGLAICVTGAGGFIGRHLLVRLVRDGHTIHSVYGMGDQPVPSSASQTWLDLSSVPCGEELLSTMKGCDWLIHLAGPASVAESFLRPERFFATHAVGTASVFQTANKAGVERRMLLSSAEVYGRASADRVSERADCNPLSPYGAAKLAAEWAARTLTDSTSARLHIVRPFSVFGPGMRANSLLASILSQARAKTEVRLHNPHVVRDYLHASDLADLVAALIRADNPPKILNACSGRGISAAALADVALRVCGVSSEVRAHLEADRPTDIHCLVGDPDLARRTLGWQPSFDVESWIVKELAPCQS